MRAVTKGAFERLSSGARGEQISSSTAEAVSRIVDTPNFPKEGIYLGLGAAGNEDFITMSEIKFVICLLGASLYSYRASMTMKICVMS